ncbi:Ubiquitin-like modifier-activating enzyme ATG7 [Frankliniella fusca]|uniref:Ubiquitin-like modifier-activating enzyme ATG7 n=1 Tax=Frankliniella fusca TaxID=407009 RepID=A0AAE1LU35_9NEOP|nr:Ubiquitin-like modifier-activating enzyme ATG7 [Frankliniella fusca]
MMKRLLPLIVNVAVNVNVPASIILSHTVTSLNNIYYCYHKLSLKLCNHHMQHVIVKCTVSQLSYGSHGNIMDKDRNCSHLLLFKYCKQQSYISNCFEP